MVDNVIYGVIFDEFMPFRSVERSSCDQWLSLRARTVVERRYILENLWFKVTVFKVLYDKMCFIIIIIVSACRFRRSNFSHGTCTTFILPPSRFVIIMECACKNRIIIYASLLSRLSTISMLSIGRRRSSLCVWKTRFLLGFILLLLFFFFATTEKKPFLRLVVDPRWHLPGV